MFASSLQNAGSPVVDCCSDKTIESTTYGGVAPAGTPGAGVAGRIDAVTGTVAVIRGNGAVEAAVPGALLQGGDFLQAADSSAVVELSSGHRIAIQEHGRLIIGAPADGATVIEAGGGRFIVFGSADGPAPASFLLINTPVAQIRFRATDVAFQHAATEGLRVVLAENRAAGGGGVVVENGSGRATIREGDEVVIVERSDQPPILNNEPSLSGGNSVPGPAHLADVTSGLTLAEGLEVSPGGDVDASSGEPIVVTGDIGLFDLKPEPASLQEPTFTGVLASDSRPARPLPMTEELLLRAPEQQFVSDEPSQQQQSAGRISDTGVSSKKLRDWEPLGLIWDVFGNADVMPQLPDVGPDRLRRQILPTEAETMALIAPASQGMGPIDDFLGLPTLTLAGALPSTRPASISAIRSTQVELRAGSELSFDWFYDTANESPRHDTALFVIDGRIFALADAAEVSRNGATGWRTFAYNVERTGLYTLHFVTVNDRTTDDPSRLFVDNVRRDRTFGDEYAVVDSGAGWRTLVQKAVLRDDVLVTSEDSRITTTALTLLANDTDPDPFDPMGIVGLDRLGTRGSPGFSSNGTISFDPAGQFDFLAAGQTATTSFRYQADAGNGVTGFGTVQVTVVGVNDAPTARPDASAAISAEAPGTFIAVLANDDDVDTDDDRSTIRVLAAGASSGATVEFSGQPGDGIIYRPDGRFKALAAGEIAVDTITYAVQDRHGARATSTATVTIVGTNDLPSANADVVRGGEDGLIGIAALANDLDPDTSDQLFVSAINGASAAIGIPVLLPSGAVVTRSPDGTLVYDPRSRFNGLALGETATDTFRYRIDDGHGGSAEALVTVVIDGRNDAPRPVADTTTVDADSAGVSIAVLANDDDVDSDDSGASLRVVSATAASGAAVSFSGEPGAGVLYQPEGRFLALGAGETATDIIDYTVEDRHGAQSTASVTVTVRGINDAPVAVTDAATVDEDASATLGLLANDTDPDAHDTLRIVAIYGMPIAPGGQVVLTSGSIVSLDASGNLSWSSAGRFESLALGETATEQFRYRIADGNGGFAEADVFLRIEGRNDAPIAVPDSGSAAEDDRDDRAIKIDVLANDDDVDADDDPATLRVVAAQAASGASVSIGAGGLLSYSAAGRWDHLGVGETGTDIVTYTVEDRHGARSTGVVTVTVTGRNDAPTAVADTLMIDAETVLRLPGPSIMANDRDPDLHDTKRIVEINGAAANVSKTIALASGALLTVEADGNLTYDPNGRFSDLEPFQRATDSFTYTIVDGSGAPSTAVVTIEIQGSNEPPVAAPDTATTDADCAVRIPVLLNDTDADAGGNLRVLSVDTAGSLGLVRINADGTLTWQPGDAFDGVAPGQTATDTFSYVVDDFVGGRSTAIVTVTVVGQSGSVISQQELLQSYEGSGLPDLYAGFLGSVVAGAAAPAPVSDAFRPTHQTSMALLTADGSNAAAIESYLSSDVMQGGRPLIKLPSDPVANTSPSTGSATRTLLSLGPDDVVEGRITLSFDWNFVSAETAPKVTDLNDYAVFTVTDGSSFRVFKLADARGTIAPSEGWRTSVFELGSAFALPSTGELRLTVGFAVLNDETPANPSHLMIDNLRLNRPFGSDFELIRSEAGGTFVTYRERPAAGEDAYSVLNGTVVNEDTAASLAPAALLANDRPSPGATHETARLLGVDATGALAAVSMDDDGGIRWNPRGRFDFLAAGETANDTFGYTITDANGGLGTGRVTLTVTGLNDAPVAGLDASAAEENGPAVAVSVLANDNDVDSDDDASTLRIVAASAASGAIVTFAGLAGAGIAYDLRSVAAFEALSEGETLVDTVTYAVEDRHGAQSVGTVLVTVYGRNDAPIAVPDVAGGNEDVALSIPVLANDHDPDTGDHPAVVAINGQAIFVGGEVTLASGASVSLAGDGSLVWAPRAAFAAIAAGQASSDGFTYTIADSHGGTSSARVDVNLAGVNDAPVAGSDFLSTAAARLTIAASTLLANDTDVDAGDGVRLVGVDGTGSAGLVSFDGTNVTWDPLDRFQYLGVGETANDSFRYSIADQQGVVSTGTVSLTVHGINDAPIAIDDVAVTDEDTVALLRVVDNDFDPDVNDRPGLLSIDTSSTRGEVTVNHDGSILYDPRGRFDTLNAGQIDHDTFRYRIADGQGGTDEGVVSITITGRSDTERLVDSFERQFFEEPGSTATRTGPAVTTALQYQETDGPRQLYSPTDGSWLARLDSTSSKTRQELENFLFSDPANSVSLPKDVDGSFPASGSAAKLSLAVRAGDEVSFDWMFDARDFVFNPPDGRADNDFAVFSVTGAGAPQLFLLTDVRHIGDQGSSGWRSSVFVAPTAGELTIGFACVNDRVGGTPASENSVLLVDNVRLNRAFGPGYQVVDTQADGQFETLVHA
jgi:VCBS repeat-containing protein